MDALGQARLFMIRPGELELDKALEGRGYLLHEPTALWRCESAALAERPIPRLAVFEIWQPLAIMEDIWSEGGIGPARRDVMRRVVGCRTGLLARHADRPAGAAFVAGMKDLAMVHAVYIRPPHRRMGVGTWIMRAAAKWAIRRDCRTIEVLCSRANMAGGAFHASLGMQDVGGYHYRIQAQDKDMA